MRRGFHTLKGCGRMVGLNELGELAYDVEKRPQPAARGRAAGHGRGAAHDPRSRTTTFRDWVDALREKGRVTPDPNGAARSDRAVEAELPGRDSVIAALPKP